jgi:hypothetical protein
VLGWLFGLGLVLEDFFEGFLENVGYLEGDFQGGGVFVGLDSVYSLTGYAYAFGQILLRHLVGEETQQLYLVLDVGFAFCHD